MEINKVEEEEDKSYFFDSYAIIEIIKNNLNYKNYADKPTILTIFNLAEIYYSSLLDLSNDKAEEIYKTYRDAVVEIDDTTLKEAIKFRKEHKKQDLSYTDCIGYIYARRHSLIFLTGDKEFKDLEGVEFVK